MLLTLKRIRSNELCTLGVLTSEVFRPFYTLELPWRDNANNISCVPLGTYRLDYFPSPKFGETWKLRDVPNRRDVEFHWGSYVHNSTGCPLLGTRFIELGDGLVMLTGTRVAMQELRTTLKAQPNESFELEII